MNRLLRALILAVSVAAILNPGPILARGGGHSGGHGGGHYTSARASSGHHSSSRASGRHSASQPRSARVHTTRGAKASRAVAGVKRDRRGRIARSPVARRQFMAHTGYPHGRPGYVVDHIVPLKRGGADNPSNMQWQTKAEARAKDKWE